MATLIDDLLHLSWVTRAKVNLQDVDLSAEVTAICGQFRAREPGRQVRVTVQEGVRATADRALIRSALENLLDNAWKFTARRDAAAIEFATTSVGDAPICCYVRDPWHRRRPGQRPAQHRTPRRSDLGRRRRRRRRHRLLHRQRDGHVMKD
jgi:light-regulated signal transduction histidine kinase (bacteriophytochrome)